MNWIDILQIVIPALAGGGATWLISFRLSSRKSQYTQVLEIIETFPTRLAQLTKQVSDLMSQQLTTEEETNNLIRENKELQQRQRELKDEVGLLKKQLEDCEKSKKS